MSKSFGTCDQLIAGECLGLILYIYIFFACADPGGVELRNDGTSVLAVADTIVWNVPQKNVTKIQTLS